MLESGRTVGLHEAARRCMDQLAPLLTLVDQATVTRELVRLSLACIPRREDPDNGSMRAAVFLECLLPYPADVAIWACREWVNGPPEIAKWFPSWAELRELCEGRVKRRRALAEFCRQAVGLGVSSS